MNKKNLEIIERIIYKNGDDIAVLIARSFERIEKRIDASEALLNSRLSDIDDAIFANREDKKIEEVKCTCSCGNEHMTTK